MSLEETQSTNRSYPSPARAWYAVIVLMSVSILGYVDRLVLGFLVDPIKGDLQLSDTQIGLLTGAAFALLYVVMGLPLGRWIDLGVRRSILAGCVGLWSLATAACGFAGSFVSLFAARMVVAVGEAGLNPSAVSMISDLFPRRRVALPIAIFSLGIYVGGGLAIIIGGELVALFSSMGRIDIAGFESVAAWRLVFVATGVPGVLLALLLWLTVREPQRHIADAQEAEASASLGGVFAYLRREWRLYGLLFGGLFTFGFFLYAVLGWYPAMLLRTYGVGAQTVAWGYGLTFLVAGVGGALSIGPVKQWFESRGTTESSVMVCLCAMLLMTVPAILGPLMPSFWLCIACFAMTKFCWAATITVGFTAVAEITPNGLRGLMTSVYMAAMNVTGGALGAVLVGLLSDLVFGPEQIRYALSAMAAVFVPIAALLFYLVRPVYRQRLVQIG